MHYTRREVGRLALAGIPAVAAALKSESLFARRAKPDSKWAGVQVGLNVPYSFGTGNYTTGDEILKRCLTLGISAVELRAQPVELFLGSPEGAAALAGGGRGPNGGGPAPAAAMAETMRKWRLTAPMSKVRDFRKTYEDAGVAIQIVKFDNIFAFSDDELDYAFTLAKTLGGRAISCEMPIATEATDTKRLGQFADKHQIWVGYHGHTAVTPAIWEQAFSYAKYNGANLDLGHFVAGNNTSPIPFIKQHHDRITHMHVKDRKLHDGPNVEFGKGDTPVKEALQLLRDEKWPIQATIEFEIPLPPGTDRMPEIAKCIDYCKECLLS